MGLENIQYPNEAPPDYTIHYPQPSRRRFWRRKRIGIPALLAILLILFAIIFGSVFGVKQSQSENTRRDRDRLLALQGQTPTPTPISSSRWVYHPSSTRPYYGYPSTSRRPYYGYPTTTTFPHWSQSTPGNSQSPYPYPTPGPPGGPGPLLEAQGPVPKDIGAAADAPGLTFWDLRALGRLYKKGSDGSWESYSKRSFLFAPVSVNTGNGKQTAVSVDAVSGRIVYMHFQDGQWGDWQELEFGARFLRRPAVISRAQDRVDVFGVDDGGHVWVVSYDGSSWSEWTELGTSIFGDVSATTWGEDRIDVFAKNLDTVMHKAWSEETGWPADWDDLGIPFENVWSYGSTSSPLAVSWKIGDSGVIDLYMNSGSSTHKLFRDGQWGDWEGMFASHEGYEFPDTQSLVKGPGDSEPYAYLISRGTDNCLHFNKHNGTSWDFWTYLWCNDKEREDDVYYPTEFMPTSMIALEDGKLEIVIKDLWGNVLNLQYPSGISDEHWINNTWTNLGQPS